MYIMRTLELLASKLPSAQIYSVTGEEHDTNGLKIDFLVSSKCNCKRGTFIGGCWKWSMLDMIKMWKYGDERKSEMSSLIWGRREKILKWALYSFDSYLIEFHDI